MNLKKIVFLAVAGASATLTAGGCDYNRGYNDDCCGINGLSVNADWIYWRGRRANLDYALPYENANSQSMGSVSELCPSWDSGFRLGIEKDCDGWGIAADYTWFRTKKNGSVQDAANGHLAGTRLVTSVSSLIQGDIQYAEANWELDYDFVNVMGTYNWASSDGFDTKFFGGFSYARMDQTLDALYSATTDIKGATNAFDLSAQKIKMEAYGIRFGVSPTVTINSCFDIFGVFSYGIYAADYDRSLDYKTTTNGGQTLGDRIDNKDSCSRISSLLDLSVGARYNLGNPCNCGVDFALAVGYQFQQWINNPGFLEREGASGQTTIDRHQSEVGFDGLFVRLEGTF